VASEEIRSGDEVVVEKDQKLALRRLRAGVSCRGGASSAGADQLDPEVGRNRRFGRPVRARVVHQDGLERRRADLPGQRLEALRRELAGAVRDHDHGDPGYLVTGGFRRLRSRGGGTGVALTRSLGLSGATATPRAAPRAGAGEPAS
jgi:hypothetical protein